MMNWLKLPKTMQRCAISQSNNQQRSDQSSSFTTVGENMAATTSQENDYVGLVQAWYDEVQDYTHGTGCADGAVCGHYTQVRTMQQLY